MRAFLRRWAGERSGAAALVFAVTAVAMILAVGAGVDLSRQAYLRSRLSDAVDAAALGLIGKTSREYVAASGMTNDGALPNAQDDATALFNASVADVQDMTLKSLQVVAAKAGQRVTASVTATATIPTYFMGIAGFQTMTVTSKSAVENDLPSYIDFYLLLDNSPSMGVGATPTDVATMVSHTSDQCAFACHQLDNSNSYYVLAKKLGVTMRIDVLRQATQQLMDTAASTETMPNQFRMAIATFGGKAELQGYTPIIPSLAALPPTSDLGSAKTAAAAIDLMTVPNDSYNNDRDTDLTAQMGAANTVIPVPGDGSSAAKPQKVLFVVSDGVNDKIPLLGKCQNGSFDGSTRCMQPMDQTNCNLIKARGIRIAVLYTTYLPLPTNDYYNTHIAGFQPNIGTQMQACASPGLYFEVSPTQGIADAMNALFIKTVQTARIVS